METQESTLDKIRNRPRFKMFTNLTKEEYAENLKKYLSEHKDEFRGNINKEMATITVFTKEDNYWKPCLSLRTEIDEGVTVIRGVFGPSSAVWTFFMFLYFLFSIMWMTFFTMYYVESQINSHEFPWALNASFVMLILIAATYTAARLGQHKAKEEMQKLRNFAENSTLQFEKNN
ncbi:hypothetical protein [Chryseobacterium echinoideorum]|uniref:hypothetical protein n=1 Tax=Chryseobacterium echinoideorum TaxID=1549648 RepID=UPI0011853703|nr:hypothetical protein [Chryseobacterium echinoideorum]